MQMVLLLDDPTSPVTECSLANSAFGVTGCCADPGGSLCNKPLPILQVSAEWAKVGYGSTFTPTAVSFDDITAQISTQTRPVECGLAWAQGGGHAVLVIGCFVEGTNQWVDVNDPTWLFKRILFSELQSAYKMGQWVKTWTDVRKEH